LAGGSPPAPPSYNARSFEKGSGAWAPPSTGSRLHRKFFPSPSGCLLPQVSQNLGVRAWVDGVFPTLQGRPLPLFSLCVGGPSECRVAGVSTFSRNRCPTRRVEFLLHPLAVIITPLSCDPQSPFFNKKSEQFGVRGRQPLACWYSMKTPTIVLPWLPLKPDYLHWAPRPANLLALRARPVGLGQWHPLPASPSSFLEVSPGGLRTTAGPLSPAGLEEGKTVPFYRPPSIPYPKKPFFCDGAFHDTALLFPRGAPSSPEIHGVSPPTRCL